MLCAVEDFCCRIIGASHLAGSVMGSVSTINNR